jgi:hypothetical protein
MEGERIESSPEIVALLTSFMEKLDADMAILYKFIEQDDMEGTEILDLLCNSSVASDDFYNEIVDNKCFTNQENGLKELVENYKKGILELDDENVKKDLDTLKGLIKVLRFCDIAGRDPYMSRWKFDYAHRPPKYIIFADDILKEKYRTDPIKDEGITAYFCRKKKVEYRNEEETEEPPPNSVASGVLDRKRMDNHPAHSMSTDEYTSFCNLDSKYTAWLILESQDMDNDSNEAAETKNKVIGCMRFEYYPSGKLDSDKSLKKEDDKLKIIEEKLTQLALKPVIDLAVREIENVMVKQKKLSYSEQYRCLEPILSQLVKIGMELRKRKQEISMEIESKKIKPEESPMLEEIESLNQIHNLLEHLFYVLKRNTYYGEAIFKRINRFIKDLLKVLGLPENIFGNIWESLQRHEELMLYSLDNYRDHLMHQFHVFVIGYIIIYSYGIEDLKKLLDIHYIEPSPENVNNSDSPNDTFSKTDVLRIWAMASLFHDCGYAFEKLSHGFEAFSKRLLGTNLKSYFFWDEVILGTTDIPVTLQRICDSFTACERYCYQYKPVDLFRILLQKATKENDHGVISSIILMQQYLSHHGGHEKVPKIEKIMNIAAISIALHNSHVFEDVMKQINQPICLKQNPIAFLLAYCDVAQEWGRKKTLPDEQLFTTPHLYSLNFHKKWGKTTQKMQGKRREGPSEKRFRINLKYRTESKGLRPNVKRIKEKLNTALHAFAVPKDYIFEIFYNIRDSEALSFKQTFSVCGNCPDDPILIEEDIKKI